MYNSFFFNFQWSTKLLCVSEDYTLSILLIQTSKTLNVRERLFPWFTRIVDLNLRWFVYKSKYTSNHCVKF